MMDDSFSLLVRLDELVSRCRDAKPSRKETVVLLLECQRRIRWLEKALMECRAGRPIVPKPPWEK